MHSDVRDAIVRSRMQSLNGNFTAASDTLQAVSASDCDPSTHHVLAVEIAQNAFFRADHRTISAITIQQPSGGDTVNDLLNLLVTMNRIWTDLDLTEPVSLANTMFDRYQCAVLKKGDDEIDEPTVSPLCCKLRILFHCLVIHDWHRMYGDGLPPPSFKWDRIFLQSLIAKLVQRRLYFELLDVFEFLVEQPEDVLAPFVAVLKQEASPATPLFVLCLARIHCRNGDLDQAAAQLHAISSVSDAVTTGQKLKGVLKRKKKKSPEQTGFLRSFDSYVSLQRGFIEQGYLAAQTSTIAAADRVSNLLNIADSLRARHQDYLSAFKTLELAAELLNLIPDLSAALEQGTRLHRALTDLCLTSGDQLSRTLVEFRHCDLLNSAGGDFAQARARRGELLEDASACHKLPHLQRFHHRQWAEYYMLHQRQPAIAHAERYYAFCLKCRDGQEQSRARAALLQSSFLPERTSDESRLGLLEDLRRDIVRGIEVDRRNGWPREQVEKQLLLVNVTYEIGRLEQEDEDVVVADDLVDILDSAEATVAGLSNEADDLALKCQIDFLRTSANLFLDRLQLPDHPTVDPIFHEDYSTDLTSSGDYMEKIDPRAYLQSALAAIINDNLVGFKSTHDAISERLKRVVDADNVARRVALLAVKGQIYYFLTIFDDGKTKQFWPVVRSSSRQAIAIEALNCFEEATRLRGRITAETRDLGSTQSTATAAALASSQAYHSSSAQIEQCINMSIELAHELDDSLRTWQWIQLGKAHAFTQVLAAGSVPPSAIQAAESLTTGDHHHDHPGFEILQTIQSASATQLVFIDWISHGLNRKTLLMSICRVIGRDCRSTQLDLNLDLDELRTAAAKVNEVRMNDSDAQRYLRPFEKVIQTLEEFSKPGDILVLSPSTPFHNVPLHAVQLGAGSQVLIERNPVVYVPSQLALLTCLERLAAPERGMAAPSHWKAVVAAAYEDGNSDPTATEERSKIYRDGTSLASDLDAQCFLGDRLTEHAALDGLESADLFHFHGHGVVDRHRPTEQRLALADGHLTIPQLASLRMRAAHVCLIACSGASQDFSLSLDEPFGLAAAFLLGGAASVVGALWPIQSSTGRLFASIYYEYFLNHVDRKELGPIVNVARALQHTVTEIKRRPDTASHYHWAPYIAYGNWFCRRKPGSW